ncbi:MAG: enoyl-CoA hydratase/isomerase family protein [Hyphomicrobiaceae bacterium]
MPDAAFTVSTGAHLATIELCRPDSGNRLTAEEVRALGEAIRKAGSDPSVNVVVVRAQGDAFCLGRAPGGGPAPQTALEIRQQVAEPILSLYANVRATETPVIAAVQGPALGFGTAFVAVCDLAIAADSARFAFTEMTQNLPPTLAMSAAIDKMPAKHMLHMVLTREEITAERAREYGIVSQVTPRSQFDDTVKATAALLTDRDRAAVCGIKEYLVNALTLDAASSARFAANTISTILASQKK